MIVVSDTSAISNLIVIDKLEILESVFKKILIPEKVYEEILGLKSFGFDLIKFESSEFIFKCEVTEKNLVNSLSSRLDLGEAEAITLAKEIHADYLLIDEILGRRIAKEMGIITIGLIGVLIKAKEMKVIKNVKEVLDLLKTGANF
jgi:predicted nucleic acid-binding protein